MRKLIVLCSTTFVTLLFTFSINLSTPDEVQARSSEYKETVHFCSNGSAVMRCKVGTTGCDISAQCLCSDTLCEA